DQMFNMQAGRKVMEHFGLEPQNFIMMKPLVGNDGRQMGKSLMNFIPILAKPSDMFGQLMSINDEVMEDYFVALTRIPIKEIKQILKEEEPIDAKKKLAFEITKFYSSEKDAIGAEKHFKKTVQSGEIPEDMETFQLSKLKTQNSKLNIIDLLDETGLTPSRGEAKRLIKQGGVLVLSGVEGEAASQKILDVSQEIEVKKGMVVRAGKRNWIKLQ
ncbi:MAG TPA: tyrosine--tRNA ligase, partial [bacterium]|nr:tyrosine--tRNA ligase [bacterium]